METWRGKEPSCGGEGEGRTQASSFRVCVPVVISVASGPGHLLQRHLWGSAWRRWAGNLHMAVILVFSWYLGSSFSSSSRPKLLSPSFLAFSSFSLLPSLL